MSIHVVAFVPLEDVHAWHVSPTFWLWVEDILAAVGLAVFIGSAWLLTALVQVAMPS